MTVSLCTTCRGYGYARGGPCWTCNGAGTETTDPTPPMGATSDGALSGHIEHDHRVWTTNCPACLRWAQQAYRPAPPPPAPEGPKENWFEHDQRVANERIAEWEGRSAPEGSDLDRQSIAELIDPQSWRKQSARWGSEISARRTNSLLAADRIIAELRRLRAGERLPRAGEQLHRKAKELGWKDDGEGAYEFVARKHYEQGLEDGRAVYAPLRAGEAALRKSDAKFLREAARYFENRPTGGEDSAHWSNVFNAKNCREIADRLSPSTGGAQGQDEVRS